MKKVNIRSVFMALIMVASLASYIFLSSIQTDLLEETAIELESVQVEESASEIFMPDVELVKKAIEVGKAVFHPFAE